MEQGGRKCVYVIDDDPQVLDSTAFLLSALGYECITFNAADEFLERAVELPSGCVLTDLRMPRTDGLELTRKFKELGFNWPIVLMTSDSAGDRAALAAAHGITTVLSKPVEADLMGDALADAFKTLHG